MKKEEGNEAFKRGNFQEAFTLYTEALAIDPINKHTNAKLYFNRATVGSKVESSVSLYMLKFMHTTMCAFLYRDYAYISISLQFGSSLIP